jgi:TetR/AcrR family tetracycline transcriptional repressor
MQIGTKRTANENPGATGVRGDKREALTKARVVETALKLVDRDGLSKLSMRKLGAELGVDPMAVYHYIPNKAVLLDGLIEAVMNELGVAPEREPDETVPDWLVRVFGLFWERLRAHPHALTVMATRPMTGESGMRSGERILAELHELGLPADEAMSALMSMTTTTIALALAEAGRNPAYMDPMVLEKVRDYYESLPAEEYPLILAGLACKPMTDWSITFQLSIRIFAAGLVATYGEGNKKPATRAGAQPAG